MADADAKVVIILLSDDDINAGSKSLKIKKLESLVENDYRIVSTCATTRDNVPRLYVTLEKMVSLEGLTHYVTADEVEIKEKKQEPASTTV